MQRTALVTGGSRGLGREVCLALGRAGYSVAVNYIQADEKARELSGEIGDCLLLKGDVSDPAAVGAMADEVKEKWGRLDVLVNNAGITADSLIVKLKEENWDRVLGVNLKGPFNTIRAFTPLMQESGGGHIVNIASRTAVRGLKGGAAYTASKAALLGLTVSAAQELAEYNIRVNALHPGFMPTDMADLSELAMQTAKEQSLLGRLSEPRDVAAFIMWLLSTTNVTGQVFTLDSRL